MKPAYGEKYERAVLDESQDQSRWVVEGPGPETAEWCPTGAEPLTDLAVGDWIERYFPVRRRCPYCCASLHGVSIDVLAEEDAELDPEGVREFTPTPPDVLARLADWVDPLYRLWACARCGFWQWCSLELPARGAECAATIVTPIIRAFEQVLPDGCAEDLAQQIARHRDRLCELSPRRLESLVADVFRANHRDGEVRHVGRPGDGGIDVVLIDDGGREWLIQVKRRANVSAVEGVETVRSLLGTMVVDGKPRGIVVTTADHFSHFAHEAAVRAKARSKGVITEVNLVDRRLFMSLLGDLIPTDGWLQPLRDGRVCFAGNIEILAQYCKAQLGSPLPRQLELF